MKQQQHDECEEQKAGRKGAVMHVAFLSRAASVQEKKERGALCAPVLLLVLVLMFVRSAICKRLHEVSLRRNEPLATSYLVEPLRARLNFIPQIACSHTGKQELRAPVQ